MDVDNECLSDQECSAGRKCCPSPFDDEACQLLCLEPEPQSKKPHIENQSTHIGHRYLKVALYISFIGFPGLLPYKFNQ